MKLAANAVTLANRHSVGRSAQLSNSCMRLTARATRTSHPWCFGNRKGRPEGRPLRRPNPTSSESRIPVTYPRSCVTMPCASRSSHGGPTLTSRDAACARCDAAPARRGPGGRRRDPAAVAPLYASDLQGTNRVIRCVFVAARPPDRLKTLSAKIAGTGMAPARLEMRTCRGRLS